MYTYSTVCSLAVGVSTLSPVADSRSVIAIQAPRLHTGYKHDNAVLIPVIRKQIGWTITDCRLDTVSFTHSQAVLYYCNQLVNTAVYRVRQYAGERAVLCMIRILQSIIHVYIIHQNNTVTNVGKTLSN